MMDDLPHDIILHIFNFLEDNEVAFCSSSCLHWRQTLSDQLWRRRLTRPSHDNSKLISSQLSTNDNHWMQLCLDMNWVLKKPTEFLIWKAKEASSTDYDQVLGNTLLNNQFYWSSKLSYDEESNEYVVFKLCQPICVITSVSISAYQAAWQRGSPAYAPKSIRISIGFTRDHMHYISDLYPIDNVSTAQVLVLEEPQFGKFIKLDLLGRQQRQPGNEAWYTALKQVRAIGSHIKLFEKRSVLMKALEDYRSEHEGETKTKTTSTRTCLVE